MCGTPGGTLVVWPLTPWLIQLFWLGNLQVLRSRIFDMHHAHSNDSARRIRLRYKIQIPTRACCQRPGYIPADENDWPDCRTRTCPPGRPHPPRADECPVNFKILAVRPDAYALGRDYLTVDLVVPAVTGLSRASLEVRRDPPALQTASICSIPIRTRSVVDAAAWLTPRESAPDAG